MSDIPTTSVLTDSFLDELVNTGKAVSEIMRFQTYPGHPAMLPPVPSCNYIDNFEHPGLKMTKAIEKEINKQSQEEGEILLYRALESLRINLDENLVVMQNFKYSHGQYKMFVKEQDSKCTKSHEDVEGETDFVILSDKCIVVIEVKVPSVINATAFQRNYDDSKKQRRKTELLIEGIAIASGCTEKLNIHTASCFPYISEENLDSLAAVKNLKVDKDSLILSDHIKDLPEWWSSIKANKEINFPKLPDALLGLWCTNLKNEPILGECLLSNKVVDIDQNLRSMKITRQPSRPVNPNLRKGIRKFLKDFLEIECLTLEQDAIIEESSPKLYINGPAGSGKSVILLSKLIEQALDTESSDDKIALIINGTTNKEFYLRALKRANISYSNIFTWNASSEDFQFNLMSDRLGDLIGKHKVLDARSRNFMQEKLIVALALKRCFDHTGDDYFESLFSCYVIGLTRCVAYIQNDGKEIIEDISKREKWFVIESTILREMDKKITRSEPKPDKTYYIVRTVLKGVQVPISEAKSRLDSSQVSIENVRAIFDDIPKYRTLKRLTLTEVQEKVLIISLQYEMMDLEPALKKLTELLQSHHIFLDDYPLRVEFHTRSVLDLDWMRDLFLGDRKFVFTSDYAQTNRHQSGFSSFSEFHLLNFRESHLISWRNLALSCNVRNSYNIGMVLDLLRKRIIKARQDIIKSEARRFNVIFNGDSFNRLAPQQSLVHLIRGPKLKFYTVSDEDASAKLLDFELQKLNTIPLDNLGIINAHYRFQTEIAPDSSVKEDPDSKSTSSFMTSRIDYQFWLDSKIPDKFKECVVSTVTEVYSAEWAAVVILMNDECLTFEDLLSELYLCISRARAYCSVILLKGIDLNEYHKDSFETLLSDLRSYADVHCVDTQGDALNQLTQIDYV